MRSCPSAQQLLAFLSGDLTESDQGGIGDHVNGCRKCQLRLDELTAHIEALPAASLLPGFPTEHDEPDDGSLDETQPAHDEPTHPIPADFSSSPSIREWPALPDYQILSEIGRGGMGIVYKARQISLHRLVALKMVLAGAGASEAVMTRFRNEAEAVARLQHVNIVQIFAIGEHCGLPYLALELVDGTTLAHVIDNTPQRPRASAAMVETLARAIHVAHEMGIVHRDLKPSNVLVKHAPQPGSGHGETVGAYRPKTPSPSPRTRHLLGLALRGLSPSSSPSEGVAHTSSQDHDLGVPKITDFGLAKVLDGEVQLTRTGEIMGTPCYMAPEQATAGAPGGRAKRAVGPAADIYSLGAILYELLTGRPPFKGKSTVETLLQVLHDDPVSPSRLQPRIPTDLTTICLKCLEKDPRKRYESALDLADDLGRFRRGEPVLARRVGTVGQIWRWARRRPGLAAMAALLLTSLVGGFIGMAHLWLRAEGHRQTAVASGERAETTLYFSRIAHAQLAWRLNDTASTVALLQQCVPGPGELDRRGWEWHYLNSLTTSAFAAFTGGNPYVTRVAFTPDGRQLLTGGGDPFVSPGPRGSLQLWDVRGDSGWKTPSLARELVEPSSLLRQFAASRDGKRVAFGKGDGTVCIWDVPRWAELRVLPGRKLAIVSLAFSPDAQLLASGDEAGRLTVWNVADGSARYKVEGLRGRFTTDGSQLITVGRSAVDSTSYPIVRDAMNGNELSKLSFEATNFELSPDGTAMVVWSGVNARVVNWKTGQTIATLASHSSYISEASFSPDGLHVATASSDQTARLSDARTGAEEFVFRGYLNRVGSVAFDSSGRFLATGERNGPDIKLWDLTRRPDYVTAGTVSYLPANRQAAFNQRAVLAMRCAPGSDELLVVRTEGALTSLHLQGGSRMRPIEIVPVNGRWLVPAHVAEFSTDGRRLAGVNRFVPEEVTIWDVATGKEQMTLRGHTLPVYWVATSRDGRRWATSAVDWPSTALKREVKVWDAASGALLAEFNPTSNPSDRRRLRGAVALSPDGERVAFEDYLADAADGTGARVRVRVHQVADGRIIADRSGQDDSILTALSFSNDGKTLAAGYVRGEIALHDLERGASVRPRILQGPSASLGSLAFSPDDRLLAVADREVVQLWHVATGQQVIILQGAPPRINDNGFNPHVAWSPDGRRLISFNHDHRVSVWDSAGDGTLSDRARLAADRAFAWHVAHAQSAVWDPQRRFAAEFHLRALAGLEPPNELLRFELATLFVWLGRWQDAADQFARLHAAHPIELIGALRHYALVVARLDNQPKLREICTYARERFGNTKDAEIARVLSEICMLDSGETDHARDLPKWLALGSTTQHSEGLNDSLRAAMLYRNGRYKEVVETIDQPLAARVPDVHAPTAGSFVAMSHARLGNIAEARVWIERVRQWLADQEATNLSKPMAVVPRSIEWTNWVERRFIFREAEAVVKDAEKRAAPK